MRKGKKIILISNPSLSMCLSSYIVYMIWEGIPSLIIFFIGKKLKPRLIIISYILLLLLNFIGLKPKTFEVRGSHFTIVL